MITGCKHKIMQLNIELIFENQLSIITDTHQRVIYLWWVFVIQPTTEGKLKMNQPKLNKWERIRARIIIFPLFGITFGLWT